MKVRIESFLDGWVEFSSALGRGEARWRGSPPEFNREYEVTLSLEDPIEITGAMARVALLDANRDRCLLRGEIRDHWLCVEDARLPLGGSGHRQGWHAVRSQALIFSPGG